MSEDAAETPPITKRTFSRSSFLRLAGGTVTAFAGAAALDTLTGSRLTNLMFDKAMSVWEIAESIERSRRDSSNDQVEFINWNRLITQPNFRVSELRCQVKNLSPFTVTLTELSPKTKWSIASAINNSREALLNSLSGPGVVGPISYLGDPDSAHRINLMYPTRSSTAEKYGPETVQDRFPGLDPTLNEASGGIVINNGKLQIVNKTDLIKAQQQGVPFMQMVYYLDQDNYQNVMAQTWDWASGLEKRKIGDTVYSWSAYLEYENQGVLHQSIIAVNKQPISLYDLGEIAKGLSDNGRFKIALSDAGNGSSILTKEKKMFKSTQAFGRNGFDIHLSPVGIVAQ